VLTHIQLHVLFFFSLDGHAKQNLGKAFTATRLSVICLIQSCETVFKKHWRKIKLSINFIISFMILLTTKTSKIYRFGCSKVVMMFAIFCSFICIMILLLVTFGLAQTSKEYFYGFAKGYNEWMFVKNFFCVCLKSSSVCKHREVGMN
jgi:hypothetical protein